MRAYVHVQRWGATGGLDPLINRIARNLLIDRHRRVAPHLVPLDNAAEVQDPAADPTEEVIRRQRSTAIHSAVSELPERHQTALLYSMRGMTPAEVGDRLGIGRNAADALLHRARRSLRERLTHAGEGMLGIGVWFRIRIRHAAGRAGLTPGVEAGAGQAASVGLAAAAAVVAAIGFAGGGGFGGGGSAGGPSVPAPRAVAIGWTNQVDRAEQSQSGSQAPASGRRPVVDVNGNTVRSGDGDIETDTGIDNPKDPDQRILGVGPDVIHTDNEESMLGSAYDDACAQGAAACHVIYQEPAGGDDEGENEPKGR